MYGKGSTLQYLVVIAEETNNRLSFPRSLFHCFAFDLSDLVFGETSKTRSRGGWDGVFGPDGEWRMGNGQISTWFHRSRNRGSVLSTRSTWYKTFPAYTYYPPRYLTPPSDRPSRYSSPFPSACDARARQAQNHLLLFFSFLPLTCSLVKVVELVPFTLHTENPLASPLIIN